MDTFDKQTLRNRVKELLQALPEAFKKEASLSICQHLFTYLRSLDPSPTVLLAFLPFQDEPDLRPFYRKASSLFPYLPIGFPRIEGNALAFYRWSPPFLPEKGVLDSHWEKGPFGTIEPAPSLPQLGRDIPWGDNPLVLVPGRVFDRKGGRIGRGKGYYDRFLRYLRQRGTDGQKTYVVTAIGICFSVQVVKEVPRTEQDERIDYLITEEGML